MKRTITIAGGGLSGLALANGLRLADVPVEVLEAGHYPRHRVCGEFLAGLSTRTINTLGLASCFEDALLHQTSKWFRRGKLVKDYSLPHPALGISRLALDSRMADLLRARGGVIHEGVRQGKAEAPGLINTCGRPPKPGGYIGLKGHWSDMETEADLELHLGTHCYMGLSKVEGNYVNVCGLFQKLAPGAFSSPVDRFHATLQLNQLGYLSQRLEKADFRPSSLCSISGLDYHHSIPREAALGDRHRQIPPFTGNGMTIAIESAANLLPLAVGYAEHRMDWNDFLTQSRELLQMQLKRRYFFANLLHPFLLRPGFQSLLCLFSRSRLVPFQRLYRLTHT